MRVSQGKPVGIVRSVCLKAKRKVRRKGCETLPPNDVPWERWSSNPFYAPNCCAAGRLQEPPRPSGLAATGTAGRTPAVETAAGTRKRAIPGRGVRRDANREADDSEDEDEPNPLRIADLCDDVREEAIGRDGSRTHTPVSREGILSPQCLPFHHAAGVVHYPESANDRTCGFLDGFVVIPGRLLIFARNRSHQ